MMVKPIRDIDPYAFDWPCGLDTVANDFLKRTAEYLIDKTPAERVAYLDTVIPALRRPSGSVSATDQHLALTALTTWREENLERASA